MIVLAPTIDLLTHPGPGVVRIYISVMAVGRMCTPGRSFEDVRDLRYGLL
jgi:hypothetical protein